MVHGATRAQDIPTPPKKPQLEQKELAMGPPLPQRRPEPGVSIIRETLEMLGPPKPEAGNMLQDAEEETPSPETAETPGFNIIDFTASLLNFSGPPIPERKPAGIVHEPTVIEKLLAKARKDMPAEPISGKQADLYKLVFQAQEAGDMKAADAVLKDIDDPRLMGHVLYQRYMHPSAYTSTYKELRTWLELFNDHPGADRIYKLALARRPDGAAAPKVPQEVRGVVRTHEPTMRASKHYVSSRPRNDEEQSKVNDFKRAVYAQVRKGDPSGASQALDAGANLLDPVEYDLLRGEIAAGFLYEGQVQKALDLAAQSLERSGLHVPTAGWVAGLVNWRAGHYVEAARYFEVVARSPYASGWTAAAGSYWAARAHMRTGNVKAVSMWLKRGMAQPRTFYGLISTRALGRDFDFNWKVEPFTKDDFDLLSGIPAANRAMALVAAGQPHLAEAELLRLRPKDEEQYRALLAYAGYANLPGLALRLATAAEASKTDYYDAALYPMGPWEFDQGYRIDPALVHAIMRQESRFDPYAKSRSGARGLMQLMPATAKSVAGKQDAKLDNPETNLELGRKYLEDLLDSSAVGGDLIYLLVAYNAGPGNLARWKKRWGDVKDPLLFIELIPSAETRVYVERVLSNYWIYRLREGAGTPTLDSIAAGGPALYNGQNL